MDSVHMSIEEKHHNSHTSASIVSESVKRSHLPCVPTYSSVIKSASVQPTSRIIDQARWCHISATNEERCHRAADIADLITIPGTVNGKACSQPMLIDSGSSCNFIDQTLVDNLELSQEPLVSELHVRTANGDTIVCNKNVSDAEIAVPGYKGRHDLVVVPKLDGYEVVLGRAFLKRSKAVVDHAAATVTWPTRSVRDIARVSVHSNRVPVLTTTSPTASGGVSKI